MDFEIVYLGHDNIINLLLKAEIPPSTTSEAIDLESVTGMTMTFDNVLIESENGEADQIQWAKEGYADGEVRIFLGTSSIPPGVYKVPVVVYDPSNPNGIVWFKVPIIVEGSPEVGAESS